MLLVWPGNDVDVWTCEPNMAPNMTYKFQCFLCKNITISWCNLVALSNLALELQIQVFSKKAARLLLLIAPGKREKNRWRRKTRRHFSWPFSFSIFREKRGFRGGGGGGLSSTSGTTLAARDRKTKL